MWLESQWKPLTHSLWSDPRLPPKYREGRVGFRCTLREVMTRVITELFKKTMLLTLAGIVGSQPLV